MALTSDHCIVHFCGFASSHLSIYNFLEQSDTVVYPPLLQLCFTITFIFQVGRQLFKVCFVYVHNVVFVVNIIFVNFLHNNQYGEIRMYVCIVC